jgi:hypothetical protein
LRGVYCNCKYLSLHPKNFFLWGHKQPTYSNYVGNGMSLGEGKYPVIKKMKFFLIRTRSKDAITLCGILDKFSPN